MFAFGSSRGRNLSFSSSWACLHWSLLEGLRVVVVRFAKGFIRFSYSCSMARRFLSFVGAIWRIWSCICWIIGQTLLDYAGCK